MLAKTLTEAARDSGVVVISRATNATYSSNARNIPYVDIYRDRTGVMETPAEHIQRAAEDERRRAREGTNVEKDGDQ